MEPKIIKEKINIEDLTNMAPSGDFIKIVVDIERNVLALGSEFHIDCYQKLLEDGSQPQNIWGVNIYPSRQRIDFISMVNIRPPLNSSMEIKDHEIKYKIEEIIKSLIF